MHTISPYLFRCFDPNCKAKKVEDRYSVLDKIGSLDVFQLLSSFLNSKSGKFNDLADTKQVFRFEGLNFDSEARVITGWLEAGSYGRRSDIINIKTGRVDFKKAEENADISRHFMYLFMPLGFNEGIALFHSYNGRGVKTLFFNQFRENFNKATKRNLQINPLSYEKAMEQWIDGHAKEIRLTKFEGYNDLTDHITGLGHYEQELKLKPPRKSNFGQLKDYFSRGTEQQRAVEFLSPLCAQVKTVIEVEGRKRVFTVGQSVHNSICEIEAPEELEEEGGNPKQESIKNWCVEVANEFSVTMYPGLQVAP